MLQKLDQYNNTVKSQDEEIRTLQEEKLRLRDLVDDRCGSYIEFHRQSQKQLAGSPSAAQQGTDPANTKNIYDANSKRLEGLENQINTMSRHLAQQQSATSNLSTAHVSNTAVMSNLYQEQKTVSDRLTARHDELVNTLQETIAELRLEASSSKQNIAQLHQRLKVQHNEIRNLESLSLTSVSISWPLYSVAIAERKLQDPACILKIRIRTLMDVVMKLLYEVLTKKKADRNLFAVKAWWINTLDPVMDPENPLDEVTVDQYRFQTCLNLISAAGLASKAPYKKLIESGTLRFITQSHIELRKQANRRAHELLDMEEYRRVLQRARKATNKICSDSVFDSIGGLVDFVDEVQSSSKMWR